MCAHVLPFSDSEPLPLYNHVQVPVLDDATCEIKHRCIFCKLVNGV